MNRDHQSKSKVDESSSKSNYVLGREEGFEEGSSSSHSHVNNLQEQQRLMMLRSQGMPPPVNHMYNLEEHQRRMLHYHRMPHTDPSSSSINTVKAPVYPPGSRFLPTNLGCVRVHLRNKVDKKKSGFITTLDLYKDDPWLLDHVQNDLFPRGEWYYFTPRNKRGASSCTRTVRGRGGGTWKSTSVKKPIKDKDEKVQGYKQSLVYNKTNVNGKIEPTGWNMTEYCLYEENQDDLVLCRIKGNLEKKGFAEEVKNNNILSKQVQDHVEEAGANGVEMRTLEEDHGDTTRQPQQQEQEAQVVYIPPHHEGQGLGVEQEDHGDATQQQQQEQDAPPVLVPPHEVQEPVLEAMMNDENNFMTTLLQLNHNQQCQWDDSDLYLDVDELFREEEMMPMADILQQPVSQARDVGERESGY
ncbi:hypothetical protein Bca52824_050193 [Brassica carinata]|uniref:NAC domain-containing protein n=1 Tax=Brassica carinata TaxID=52824 RepID=A0A8X7RRU5_BRACI|nr:hypothetical protein Bca52824_050193 [Brassica carinata]